jgi:hypothetical protein
MRKAKKDPPKEHLKTAHKMTVEEYKRQFASKGGKARAQNMTAEERRNFALNAIRARWANVTPKEREEFRKKVSRAAKARWAKARKAAKDVS